MAYQFSCRRELGDRGFGIMRGSLMGFAEGSLGCHRSVYQPDGLWRLACDGSTNFIHPAFQKQACYSFVEFVEEARSMTETGGKATIQFAGDDFFVGITPSGHAQTIETSSARIAAASPMELLLIALGGCTGIDVISILKKKRQQITDYRIEVSGERRDDHPRAYTRLFVKHIVRGHDVSDQAVAQAIKLSDEKYCSVAATLRGAAEILTSYEIIEDDAAQ